MKPLYDITPRILSLVSKISEKIGETNATFLVKANPTLRKQNKIKTIHASLHIEGNTLTAQQITALIENQRVIGPAKDIRKVKNAIDVYENILAFQYASEKSFLEAHKKLMSGLMPTPGHYRKGGLGIVKGSQIKHFAPPASNVPALMKTLFTYARSKNELTLIKSCVFHYEMEFIHPFADGNGRMSRLWQTVILMKEFPVFQFLPFETLILESQQDYYNVLSRCDKMGKSTLFIAYLLSVIDKALQELLSKTVSTRLNQMERLEHFRGLAKVQFSRKDYLSTFKNISEATASRDLKRGVELGYFHKTGDKGTQFTKPGCKKQSEQQRLIGNYNP